MIPTTATRAPGRISRRRASSSTLPALFNEQKIRDLYMHRVGFVDAERTAGSPEAPFKLLEMHLIDHVGHAYATLGASAGPLQNELVMLTNEPLPAYADALEAIACAAPELSPLAVLPHAIADTPFTALLCLPVDGVDGSLALGKAGGAPFAFRLAPLTAAERALAEREPARARELLSFACAFTADRYRGCLVDVPPPPPATRTEAAMERRRKRAALIALQADVLREHGPREPRKQDLLGLPPQRRREMRLRVGSALGLIGWVEEMSRAALIPYARHPAAIVHAFVEFVYATLATHPDAVRMLDRAIEPRSLPSLRADGAEGQAAAARRVTEALAVTIVRLHPGESEEKLAATALPAVREALSRFDPEDEIPVENHVWAAALPAMFEHVEDFARPALRGMARVYKHVAQEEILLEYERDPRPPLMRVNEILPRIAAGLVTAYAAERRGRLPG